MTAWTLLFAAAAAIAATAFVVLSFLWLRRLRTMVTASLGEATGQQLRTTRKVDESLAEIQKQQRAFQQQLQTLAKANLKLQQEVSAIVGQMGFAENEEQAPRGPDRTIH